MKEKLRKIFVNYKRVLISTGSAATTRMGSLLLPHHLPAFPSEQRIS